MVIVTSAGLPGSFAFYLVCFIYEMFELFKINIYYFYNQKKENREQKLLKQTTQTVGYPFRPISVPCLPDLSFPICEREITPSGNMVRP